MNDKADAVIRAALDLFSEHGYHAVGVDLVIARSQVAKRTFYKYFSSKEKLIEQVLVARDHAVRSDIVNAVEGSQLPIDKLESLFTSYRDCFAQENFHGCMFIKASEEYPELNSGAKKISQEHKRWLVGLVEGLLREVPVGAPDKLASYIVTVLDGLTVRVNMDPAGGLKQVDTAWQYVRQLIEQQDSP